eukprot:TRINITY_DN1607_c0_g1_i1.p1 TRINITY_DN1607_c0_g1~~TRINITY_DN1607_c0_g1_i1.p1  ORF type:complete len:258 (-),score=99.52 TRINITY_DN1607_c0_g1_i1:4-777(-)
MVRPLILVVAVCLLVVSAAKLPAPTVVEPVGATAALVPKVNTKDCPTCINFMLDALETLWDAIGNVGILGGCEKVCGYLPKESEWVACTAICMYAGIDELARVLNTTDPDPVYVCEEINICPVSDTAAAKITDVVVDPTTAPMGTTFYVNMSFSIVNATGTGLVMLWAVPPETPFEDGLSEYAYLIETPPGDYKVAFNLPTSEKGVDWLYGVYNCSVYLCEGYCNSIHKHQYLLDERFNLLFNVTQNNGGVVAIMPV